MGKIKVKANAASRDNRRILMPPSSNSREEGETVSVGANDASNVKEVKNLCEAFAEVFINKVPSDEEQKGGGQTDS